MGIGNNCSCCGRQLRRNSTSSWSSVGYSYTPKMWPLWKAILVWSSASVLALILIAVLLIWVGIPIAFWLSTTVQRFAVFIPIQSPKNVDFSKPEELGFNGVINFYISVKDFYDDSVVTRIGAWLILPDSFNSTKSNDVGTIINETKYDILLHLHGVAANRAKPTFQYEVLRKNFLVIAIDHRGYGDSGENVEMTEDAIVNDHLQIYDWVVSQNSKNDIYYWGHSLGSALSLHTLRALKERKSVVPKGLVLEAAFTTIAEEISSNIIGKIFKWLPYFEAAVLNPLHKNGLRFHSTSNILEVDCPIMILHAEDDTIIPSALGKKLAAIAQENRAPAKQGNVTIHFFPAEKGYGHNDILKDPAVPGLIINFIKECQNFSPA